MAKKSLVIVESPTKAKTIKKFLPKEYEVIACVGHVRDLPGSAAQVPEKYREFEWAKLGVNIDDDFSPIYVMPKGKSKIIKEIRQSLKASGELLLATDEDREGESISWHLLELLKPKVPIKRMVFHEITKKAISASLDNCRELDMNLVRAQEARRILDRLYGYTLSPLIWKKIAYGLSAGRVQSSALRMIVEREIERMKFVPAEYSSLKADLAESMSDEEPQLTMQLSKVSEKSVAIGKDFDDYTGKVIAGKSDKVVVVDRTLAEDLASKLRRADWRVSGVKEKPFSSNPPIPYITSTLQQDANRKLSLPAKATMQIAQKLYEEGFITYMRTDSPTLSDDALSNIRALVQKTHGEAYLSDGVRQFKSKTNLAQEAHEAIRPAGDFRDPAKTGLQGKDLALYSMIWSRTVATQMKPAEKLTVTLIAKAADCEFSVSGTRILFPGYLTAYANKEDLKDVILPDLKVGDPLHPLDFEATDHKTKPIARYNEASLVQTLEKESIGRPSTYASIIGTIQERKYVNKQGSALVPTFVGMAVNQLLEKYFSRLVDYKFTSEMEASLDQIACGNLVWTDFLKNFYLGRDGLQNLVQKQEKRIIPDESRSIQPVHLGDGVEIKVGRYGPYIVCESKGKANSGVVHASIPEEIAPADLTQSDIDEIVEQQLKGPVPLGKHPDTGENIYCLLGRYGPYVQLGEVTEENPKPKRQSLPKGETMKTMTLEMAVKALILPREIGMHPEKKVMITANIGRFGAYVECNKEYRSIKEADHVYTIGLEEAVTLLAQEKKGRGSNKLIKEYADVPKKKQKAQLYIGRFGPYIKVGKKNYGIPKDLSDGLSEEKLASWDSAMIKKIISESSK